MLDQWSPHVPDRRGAVRPVDEGAFDPRVVLLDEPGCGWRVMLLRDSKELLLNIGEFGIDRDSPDGRELIVDISSALVFNLREDPQLSDEDLDDIAVESFERFSVMSVEHRSALMQLARSSRWRNTMTERTAEFEQALGSPAGSDPEVELVTETDADWTVRLKANGRRILINLAHLGLTELAADEAADYVGVVASDLILALRDGCPRTDEQLSVRAQLMRQSLAD